MHKYLCSALATIFICITFSCFANYQIGDIVCSPQNCYTIKKFLGQGAFGMVFQIADSKTENYALKSYTYTNDSDGDNFWDLLGNTEREYQRGKMLNHPNIVKSIEIFKSGTDYEIANLILEFVDGQSVSNIEDNIVPYEKARIATHHFVEAMLHGISLNLLHLDLHSGNVMITQTQDIKVIDLASFFTIKEILNFEKEMKQRSLNPLVNRELKIQKFFNENPDLLDELLQIDEEYNEDSEQDRMTRRAAKISQKENAIYGTYFYNVANMCINIIEKSNLATKKRNAITNKINTLQDEYKKNIKNKKIVSVEDYFNKLKKAVH